MPSESRAATAAPANGRGGENGSLGAPDRRTEGLRLAREALAAERPLEPVEPERAPVEHEPAGTVSDTALTVAGFYERLRLALRSEFPDEIWVTGEIRKVTVSKGHRYIELADHDPDGLGAQARSTGGGYGNKTAGATLDVACWSRDWPPVSHALEAVGVELTAGLVVRIRGRVSVWEAGAKIRFSMSALDVEALVGGIAAARRKLLTSLEAEGIIDANRRLAVPLVPLRIGLVTSAGSEAYRDFTGQLQRSGLEFRTRLEASLVQGADAASQIAAALARLQGEDLDLVVLVRGGGAKGDLAAFDHELVARAILSSRYPVWTGIGHTGDRSVADEIAQRALVTPTACGEAVVDAVLSYLDGLSARASRIAVVGERSIERAARDIKGRRSDLSRAARHELAAADASLRAARGRAERGATVAVERCASTLSLKANRILAMARQSLVESEHRLARAKMSLEGFDPRRQMERGWSLTRTVDGSILRSVSALSPGDAIVTMLADGTVASAVSSVTKNPEGQQ